MTAIEAANELLSTAILEHSNGRNERGDRLTQQAQAYAAIAQAEQLKRIADALENISGAYSIDLPARPAFDAWADYDRNH